MARLGRSGGGRGVGCVQSIGAMCSVFGRMCSVSGPMCSLFGRMCSVWRARCSVFGGTPWSEREHGRKARFPIRQALRQAQGRFLRQAQDGVLGDAGMTGMCPPGQANVSSFWPDVSSFGGNVSSSSANVSSFGRHVSSFGRRAPHGSCPAASSGQGLRRTAARHTTYGWGGRGMGTHEGYPYGRGRSETRPLRRKRLGMAG